MPGAEHADPMAALRAQLAAQAEGNPGLAMLLQMMESRPPQAAAGSPADTSSADRAADVLDADHSVAPGLGPALQNDLRVLVQGSQQLAAELAVLQERNDALAAALGACHLCFGADAWCPHCGGCGQPGSQRPESTAFARYVRPLLQRLQHQQRQQRQQPEGAAGYTAASIAPLRPSASAPPGGSSLFQADPNHPERQV